MGCYAKKSFSCLTQLRLCKVELSCGWVGALTKIDFGTQPDLRYLPNNLCTSSRHFQDTFHTPSRHPPDTIILMALVCEEDDTNLISQVVFWPLYQNDISGPCTLTLSDILKSILLLPLTRFTVMIFLRLEEKFKGFVILSSRNMGFK